MDFGVNMHILSVIIPFRLSPERPYLMDRLRGLCADMSVPPEVEILFVDSDSPSELAEEAGALCASAGMRYLRHTSSNPTFSIGSVRDYGVQKANGNVVTFMDLDLVVAADFLQNLVLQIQVNRVESVKKEFFVVPCLYLTEEGTARYHASDKTLVFKQFWREYLYGDKRSVQNLAPCSSVMVVNRDLYLAIGGHRPEFSGHGYEDFELIHRLLTISEKLPRPVNYFRDSKTWDNTVYDGFRSQFAVLGTEALTSGLFTMHLWHPRPNEFGYMQKNANNRFSALEYFKKFDVDGINPLPIADLREEPVERFLMFGVPENAAAESIRDVFPFLGEAIFASEYLYYDRETEEFQKSVFEYFLSHQGITKILFPNPYGNPARFAIYEWAREHSFPFLCYERGALPESWFFDSKGFNGDSASYSPELWDHELSEDAHRIATDYIEDALYKEVPLEEQGMRTNGTALRGKLRLAGKKVLFVPLQRPSDTVIKHFCGEIESYGRFVEEIDRIAELLNPLGWVVLCKKHPLEAISPEFKHARYAPDDTHFLDLLDLSDSVALINSGVGIFAAMMGKPCYVFGHAFYSHPKINRQVSTAWGVKEGIEQGFTVDRETVRRFIYYLRNEFYSFGAPVTERRKEKDGSFQTITKRIDFYRLRIPGVLAKNYSRENLLRAELASHLFSGYRSDINARAAAAKAKAGAPAAKPVAAALPAPAAKPAAPTRPVPTGAKSASAIQMPEKDMRTDRRVRLWRKFRRAPRQYFSDSRIAMLRPLRHFFRR